MGHHQTREHRRGQHSYHQIGLVRGRFGNVPEDKWMGWLADTGFDGWEEASWELDLARCGTDQGAKEYAAERVAKAKSHKLEIFSIAPHFCKGRPWETSPVPRRCNSWEANRSRRMRPGVRLATTRRGPIRSTFRLMWRLLRKQAQTALINVVRLAHFVGQLEDRVIPVSGFVGSPAHCWSHWFLFPPLPSSLGGHKIPCVYQTSYELLVERFSPVFQACLNYGTTFDLECHPSERAMGDITSAGDYLAVVDKAGFAKATGFNFDCSHMEWQGVSGVDFIRAYGDRIHCAHIKGVQVVRPYTRNGLLGGHKPMGDKHNGWNFVTPGTARDATGIEPLFVELNRAGFCGAVSIEWEDNDVEQHAGAKLALANVHLADQPPSAMRHDEQLKA